MSVAARGEASNSDVAQRWASRLLDAERDRCAIAPLSATTPALDIGDAYAIQQAGWRLRKAQGARLVGHKIGVTSTAMQEQFGVDQPDWGYLTDRMLVASGGIVPSAELIAPRVEGEIAFRIGTPLSGGGVTARHVLDATTHVAPAIEIIDSRIIDWRITIVDTIADNASCGRLVVGAFRALPAFDLAEANLEMTVGEERTAGVGAAVQGHPAEAVAWLVRTLAGVGEGLEPGEIVLSGSLARALPVVVGQQVTVEIAGLGAVNASFA
jgi:2-keto-4-pentenoate hydratase